MTINRLHNNFTSELSSIYSKEETNIFFYMLIEEFTGLTKIEIINNPEFEISKSLIKQFFNSIERLKKQEPIQYIIGRTLFYNILLNVTDDVLIPRPETEELVDIIIKDSINKQRILDIGTGSGCIAIALKKNLPHAHVSAIDKSLKALKVAKMNAVLNNTDIYFYKMDILNYLTFTIHHSPFNIIISNPPYVRESEKTAMLPNILQYEPHSALFVNDSNPLVFYNAIADFALDNHLQNKGKLYFEINENLSDELINLLNNKGFSNIILKQDINSKPRFLSCQLIL